MPGTSMSPTPSQHGISREIVEAIRERRTPDFTREDERLVYDITLELNTTQRLSDPLSAVAWRCSASSKWSSWFPA